MHRLAQALAGLAAGGGDGSCRAAPQRIETAGGRVSGVILADGHRLPCARVVQRRSGGAGAGCWAEVQAAVPRARCTRAAFGLGLGLCRRSPRGLPLAYHNVLFAADPRAEFDEIARGEMPATPRSISAHRTGAGRNARRPGAVRDHPECPAAAADGRAPARLRRTTYAAIGPFGLARFGLTFDPAARQPP
jgi:hypothetical protein